MKWFATLALICGCSARPEAALQIRLPADRRLLAGISSLDLHAERDGRVIAEQTFGGATGYVSLTGVPYGPRTVFVLEGLTAAGDVLARGRSCPIDFEAGHESADLFFAPTNSFSPTVGPPTLDRVHPVAVALADGNILLAGGSTSAGDGGAAAAVDSTELFAEGPATFAAGAQSLSRARVRAELAEVAGIGTLVVGGVGASGETLADGEVWSAAMGQFVPLENRALGGRVGHRAVTVPDGRVLVSGGLADGGGALASTVWVELLADGTATLAAGPNLVTARREHAAVVAVGTPVLIGGYGANGKPIDSLEALGQNDAGAAAFSLIATLRFARAEATATVLSDGSILVVGGVDGSGAPRGDAEVYNPITRTTALFPLAAARSGHTATAIANGRVLIAGGAGMGGAPLSSVELFAPGIGFVSERPLGVPRAGHVAVPLCDGTVLVAGGGAGAEIYNPPAR